MAHPQVCQVEGTGRIRAARDAAVERVKCFTDAEPTLSLEQAVAEAKRCSQASPCLYCEVCELMCPDLAITRNKETSQIQVDMDYCKGCGLCAHYCPHGAISMVIEESDT